MAESLHIAFLEDTKLEGGTQIWVAEAARDAIKKGHNVTIIAPEGGFNANDAKEIDGCKLVAYDYEAIEKHDEGVQKAVTDGLKDCDVVVTTVHPPRNGFQIVPFAAKCIEEGGLKTWLVPKTGTPVESYLREYYRPSEKINSRVVTITAYTRRALLENYKIPEEHITQIYQGTEVKRFTSIPERKAEAKTRYPAPENAYPVFGCVGAYEKRKGQEYLLEALKKVADEYPNVYLVLVGKNGRDGPIEEKLKERAKEMDIEKHVGFFPFTKEPMYVYEAIDAVVVSSIMEGLPNVLLEGLAMCKPCVSTNIAGCPEAVSEGETGFLCPPADIDALATAMKSLCALGREGGTKMGETGRKLMLERMDKETQFDDFLKFYAQLKKETK